MGQKINPYNFRLGFKDNLWNSNHINSNFEEFSLFVYQDIQIKNYIYKFFKQNKIHLHFCKIFRSQTELFIFISFYVSSKSINLITQINLIQKISGKRWELYVITRVIHLLNDPDIEYVCQQYINPPKNKDYYFYNINNSSFSRKFKIRFILIRTKRF